MSSRSGNQRCEGWPETLTFWWPCRKALSTTWLYIHSSRIWAGLKGHLPRQDRGLIPKLQLAMLIEVAHELFDGFFKEQGLRGWIWLGKTLIEGSSKMLVASVSSFEWYNIYIHLHISTIDLCHFAVIISWTTASCEGSLTKSFDEDWVQAAEKRWVQWHYFCCGGQAHLRT